jgi:hypothetical protein
MHKWMFLSLLTSTLFAGELPMQMDAWFGNPLIWRFSKEGVRCEERKAQEFLLFTQAPLSSSVKMETLFTPHSDVKHEWRVAGPAIMRDRGNFWRLALVLSPPEQGSKHRFEFCEMVDNEWLAQSRLKREINITRGDWQFNVPYRMTIELDEAGITGTISEEAGEVLFKERYLFAGSTGHVTAGQPALSTTGIAGHYQFTKAEWGQPEPQTDAPAYPAYAVPPNTDITDEATGFFRVVQKPDGRWWTIDPKGHAIVLLGIDHVTFHGHWCQKLGYSPHGKKNAAKFPDRGVWEKETLDRLTSWGFNMLGAGCSSELQRRGLVHTIFLSFGDGFGSMGGEYEITPQEGRPCSVFPNVFHPDFEHYCRYQAQLKCRPNRTDPWLLGYFIDNELAWWGRGALDGGLFDYTLTKEANHSAKRKLCHFLKRASGDDLVRFNKVWKSDLNSFDALPTLTVLPSDTSEQKAIKLKFLEHAARRYFEITTRTIRDMDPNHLILGSRFAGTGGAHPLVWEISGRYCDVVTFNAYPMVNLNDGQVYTSFGKGGELVTHHFARYYDYVKRPMLITEWSFPALDSGLPCLHGAGQRFLTQAERTEATSLFARTMLALPFLLGYDYFMWVDEPALGISDSFPEDSNYGLINEEGVPYSLITTMFKELHREVKRFRLMPPPAPRASPPQQKRSVYDMARQASASSAIQPSFIRDGETFTLANGRLELKGQLGPGPMIKTILLDGKPYGYYNAMIHLPGKWPRAEQVIDVKESREGKVLLVDIVSVSKTHQEHFEVCHRIILPPDTPSFFVESRYVRNLGSDAFLLKGLFFQLRAGYPPDPHIKEVPNLWGRPWQGVWVDAQGQRCLGAVAPCGSKINVNFWLDPQGMQHADARCERVDITLAPGETLTKEAAVLCLCDPGGVSEWRTKVHALLSIKTP